MGGNEGGGGDFLVPLPITKNCHHQYLHVEPVHDAGFSSIVLPTRCTYGVGRCSVELQPRFHGAAAAAR